MVRFPTLENAARLLWDRQVVSADEFRQLSSAARQEAFTISGDLSAKSVERVRDILAQQIDQGADRKAFENRIRDEFGMLPLSPAHLEQVFRNATNEAYSQGSESVLDHPLVEDEFPYRRYVAIHDARARPNHRALESLGIGGGDVYHKDDPTWLRFRPPWDYNCRCGWIALSIKDAARRGVQEAIEWRDTGIEPYHPPVPEPEFSPSPQWDRLALV